MTFFQDAVPFIASFLRPDDGTCALLLDDEEARVSIVHTNKLMPQYLSGRRAESTYQRHLQVMGFCDGLSKEFRDDLIEMCVEFRRHVGFADDDTFIDLAQALNVVGRLRFPERRGHHFHRRCAISCPPTDGQITWATKNTEHDELPALMYARKARMECHGDPTNRIGIFPSNQPNSTGRKIYEFILLYGPSRTSELKNNFEASPDSVTTTVSALYQKGWLRRVDRATYDVVTYHDEIPLPLSVRRQNTQSEAVRERNHSRQQTYERKKRRQKNLAKQRHRNEERRRKEEAANQEESLEDRLRGY